MNVCDEMLQYCILVSTYVCESRDPIAYPNGKQFITAPCTFVSLCLRGARQSLWVMVREGDLFLRASWAFSRPYEILIVYSVANDDRSENKYSLRFKLRVEIYQVLKIWLLTTHSGTLIFCDKRETRHKMQERGSVSLSWLFPRLISRNYSSFRLKRRARWMTDTP